MSLLIGLLKFTLAVLMGLGKLLFILIGLLFNLLAFLFNLIFVVILGGLLALIIAIFL